MRHGFLLINKPRGATSHDVVASVRRALHEKNVGHLGTLDPLATGLLVLAVGSKALKVVELFGGLSKEYVATVHFGSVSTTYDADGILTAAQRPPGVQVPTEEAVRECIRNYFVGNIAQVPPTHSAVHVGGERAYRKARRGESVNMPSRMVKIDACDLLRLQYPELDLRVRCSSGTYIRSIAHDMGQHLHIGAYLSASRRTKVGGWRVEDAHSLESAAWAHVLPLKDVLAYMPGVELTARQFEDVSHGRSIAASIHPNTIAWYEGLPQAVLIPVPEDPARARPRKVL